MAHATVAVLREFAAEAMCAGVDGDEDLGGGWSAVRHADRPDGVASVAAASVAAAAAAVPARRTGAPALTVAPLVSTVTSASSRPPPSPGAAGRRCSTGSWPRTTQISVDRFPVETALACALDRAAAGGLTADPAGIWAALTGSAPCAEELTVRLLGALGIAPAGPLRRRRLETRRRLSHPGRLSGPPW